MTYFAMLPKQQEQIENLARQAVEMALDKGADEVLININLNQGVEAFARHGEIENLEFNKDQRMHIYVYKDKRSGMASTSDFKLSSLYDALASALTISSLTQRDECAGLCAKEECCTQGDDSSLEHFYAVEEDSDLIVKRAEELDKLAMAKAKEAQLKDTAGASFETSYVLTTTAHSNGFCGSKRHSFAYKSQSLVGEVDGQMQTGSSFDLSCSEDRLWSDERIIAEAIERVQCNLGARQVKTGKYNVILTRRALSDFLSQFFSANSGDLIYRNASFLKDCLQKEIFPSFLQIKEDPWVKGSIYSQYFDDDGVATFPQDIVTDGKLATHLLGVYAARKLNMQSNGHEGGAAMCFVSADEAHTRSFAELLLEAGQGLVIDRVLGNGVDLTSGNYTHGASGYYFENGQRVHAVHEITIAGLLQEMFKSIALIGNDIDERKRVRSGSILLPDVSVSGS